jgi:hypothetical protein
LPNTQNPIKAGKIAVERGKQLELEVARFLNEANIHYKHHAFIRGSGKKWNVDFYENRTKTIIECKNVTASNLELYLEQCCLKAIDIGRHVAGDLNFIVVVTSSKLPRTIVRFLTFYGIKIVTSPNALVKALRMDVRQVNAPLLTKPAKERILELIGREEGLNCNQIARKLKIRWVRRHLQELEKEGLVVGVSGRGNISGGYKRYYLKTLQKSFWPK